MMPWTSTASNLRSSLPTGRLAQSGSLESIRLKWVTRFLKDESLILTTRTIHIGWDRAGYLRSAPSKS